jgi:ribosomal protein L40E
MLHYQKGEQHEFTRAESERVLDEVKNIMEDMEKIICADCNSVLPNENDKCKKCGSTKKIIKIHVKDTMQIYDGLGFKVKDKTKNSKKNPVLSAFQGAEIHKCSGKLVNKEREVDKINNRYYEHVETFNGEILHHCDEKLTDHQGHGSAKIK